MSSVSMLCVSYDMHNGMPQLMTLKHIINNRNVGKLRILLACLSIIDDTFQNWCTLLLLPQQVLWSAEVMRIVPFLLRTEASMHCQYDMFWKERELSSKKCWKKKNPCEEARKIKWQLTASGLHNSQSSPIPCHNPVITSTILLANQDMYFTTHSSLGHWLGNFQKNDSDWCKVK